MANLLEDYVHVTTGLAYRYQRQVEALFLCGEMAPDFFPSHVLVVACGNDGFADLEIAHRWRKFGGE
jgi:hypothetical protein